MVVKQKIVNILHKVFPNFFDPRTMPQTKIALRQLYNYYADRAFSGIPLNIPDTGLRIFSQFEEDGILLAIFATIGAQRRTFVDIGAADGVNSNCANLALNFGWDGLFIDGNPVNVRNGREFYNKHPDTFAYPPRFVEAMVTRGNINDIILKAGFSGEIDLLFQLILMVMNTGFGTPSHPSSRGL